MCVYHVHQFQILVGAGRMAVIAQDAWLVFAGESIEHRDLERPLGYQLIVAVESTLLDVHSFCGVLGDNFDAFAVHLRIADVPQDVCAIERLSGTCGGRECTGFGGVFLQLRDVKIHRLFGSTSKNHVLSNHLLLFFSHQHHSRVARLRHSHIKGGVFVYKLVIKHGAPVFFHKIGVYVCRLIGLGLHLQFHGSLPPLHRIVVSTQQFFKSVLGVFHCRNVLVVATAHEGQNSDSQGNTSFGYVHRLHLFSVMITLSFSIFHFTFPSMARMISAK